MGQTNYSGPINSTAGFKIADTQIDATALEINRACDVSARIVLSLIHI